MQQDYVAKEATTAAAHVTLTHRPLFPISKDVIMAPLGSDGFMDSEDFVVKNHSEKPLRKALLLCEDKGLACVKMDASTLLVPSELKGASSEALQARFRV